MRRAIRTSVGLFSEVFSPNGPVVELGSLYPPGYEPLCDLRPLLSGKEYVGCDLRRGLGVDRIEDAHALSFSDNWAGTVLMFELLEHLPHPARALAEARRVLRDEGLLALSVPFTYRLHGFPTDYWRFTASGVHTLLADFPDKVIFALGPRLKPGFIFAVAAKTATQTFAANKARFRSKVQQTFRDTRLRGCISVLKERGRDFFGCLLGRTELSATFFDGSEAGGYKADTPARG